MTPTPTQEFADRESALEKAAWVFFEKYVDPSIGLSFDAGYRAGAEQEAALNREKLEEVTLERNEFLRAVTRLQGEAKDLKRRLDSLIETNRRLGEALEEIAESMKWGEDTAIKREISRLQKVAADALALPKDGRGM